MSATSLPPTARSAAVTAVGLLTLIWAGGHTVAGTYFLVRLAAEAERVREADPAKEGQKEGHARRVAARQNATVRVIALFCLGTLAAFAAALVLLGLVGMLGGLGVLLRRTWGRVLTMIVAAMALQAGVACIVGYYHDALLVGLGVAELAYGIPTFVVLIRKGADFARPAAPPARGYDEADEDPFGPGRGERR